MSQVIFTERKVLETKPIKQIMVVDNHPVMQKFMADFLEKKGHEVIIARDGLNALEKLETCLPDVFFIDLVMPNISGDKLCRIIRKQTRLEKSFVVILSAIAMEKQYCTRDLGADLILAKGPFDKISTNIDHILDQLGKDGGRKIRGQVLGRENLFERQISKELLESKRHSETTLYHMSEGLLELVEDAKIVYANPAASSIVKLKEEDLLSCNFTDFFENPDRGFIHEQIQTAKNTGREVVIGKELPLKSRLVTLKIIPLPRHNGRISLLAMLRDVTRQKIAEQKLVKSQEKYRQEKNFLENIFENSADAIAIVDSHGRFTRWNTKAEELFGYSFAEMKTKKAFEFYSDPRQLETPLFLLRQKGIVQNFEMNFNHKNGTSIPCAVSISLLRDAEGKNAGSLSILRDLSQWKQAEKKLKYLSFHDSLTGLYNRAFFEEEMSRFSRGRHLPLGIIVCDINGLKLINDTLGHQKGDDLLRAAAEILKKSFRSSDIIARIGGDEFAVLMPAASNEAVTASAKRIRQEIKAWNLENSGSGLSFSIGHAIEYKLPVDMHALFKKADDMMYVEKFKQNRTGRSSIVDNLIKTMETKDYIAQGHVERLLKYCWGLAGRLGLSEDQTHDLQLLVRFHDIGKVGISDEILFKPDALSHEEFQEAMRHCDTGHRIALSSPDLAPIAGLILKHHEWWNGQGYPLGLKKEEIPIECRILAVVDAYDMMTRQRPHQKAVSGIDAIAKLRSKAGTQFDPAVVEEFILELGSNPDQ